MAYHSSPRLSVHYLVVLSIAIMAEYKNPISEANVLLILDFPDS